jgi:hypothetical protein
MVNSTVCTLQFGVPIVVDPQGSSRGAVDTMAGEFELFISQTNSS